MSTSSVPASTKIGVTDKELPRKRLGSSQGKQKKVFKAEPEIRTKISDPDDIEIFAANDPVSLQKSNLKETKIDNVTSIATAAKATVAEFQQAYESFLTGNSRSPESSTKSVPSVTKMKTVKCDNRGKVVSDSSRASVIVSHKTATSSIDETESSSEVNESCENCIHQQRLEENSPNTKMLKSKCLESSPRIVLDKMEGSVTQTQEGKLKKKKMQLEEGDTQGCLSKKHKSSRKPSEIDPIMETIDAVIADARLYSDSQAAKTCKTPSVNSEESNEPLKKSQPCKSPDISSSDLSKQTTEQPKKAHICKTTDVSSPKEASEILKKPQHSKTSDLFCSKTVTETRKKTNISDSSETPKRAVVRNKRRLKSTSKSDIAARNRNSEMEPLPAKQRRLSEGTSLPKSPKQQQQVISR